jgi:hypothetical protein
LHLIERYERVSANGSISFGAAFAPGLANEQLSSLVALPKPARKEFLVRKAAFEIQRALRLFGGNFRSNILAIRAPAGSLAG